MDNSSVAKLNSRNDYRWGQSRSSVIACLRFAIALQCIGIAGRYLLSELESESHIFEYLVFDRGVKESLAQRLDDVGAYLCLTAGALFVVNLLVGTSAISAGKRNWQTFLQWLEFFAAGLVAAWMIVDALAHTARGGIYSEFTIGEIAVRFASPIALMLLFQTNSARVDITGTIAKWFLTAAISVTFLVHGYKAIEHYGNFCDLILLTDMRIFQFDLTQSTAEIALSIIGWIDVVLAIALLVNRYTHYKKTIAIYMLFWGLVTSLSRMTALGWSAWPETLVRAANWGAILALIVFWSWESVAGKDDNSEVSIRMFHSDVS